jgi:hypothetical protein
MSSVNSSSVKGRWWVEQCSGIYRQHHLLSRAVGHCRIIHAQCDVGSGLRDRDHRDERGERPRITSSVVLAQERDIAILVHSPVIRLKRLVPLCSEEGEICEQPSGPAVAVDERMDADGVSVHGDSEFARCPVLGVLPAVAGVLKGGAKRHRYLLRCDPDVQLACAEPTGPGPDVAVKLQMEIAEEVVGEDPVEAKGAVSDCVKEVFGDLGENCLLGFVNIRLVGSSPRSARACSVSASASSGSSGVSP